jgi:hypothetical protein
MIPDFEPNTSGQDIAWMARLAGLVFFLGGLALGALSIAIVWRIFRQPDIAGTGLWLLAVAGIIGYFLTSVGYRLTFDRPNRYQSILPPFGWYGLALVFGGLGVALIVPAIRKVEVLGIASVLGLATFAIMSYKAGRITAYRGKADPLMPEDKQGRGEG